MSRSRDGGNAEYEMLRAALHEWRLCQDDRRVDVVLHITLCSSPARLEVIMEAFKKGQRTTGRAVCTMKSQWPNVRKSRFEAFLFNTVVGFRRLLDDSYSEGETGPRAPLG